MSEDKLKPIQISTTEIYGGGIAVVALMEDGSIWACESSKSWKWEELPEIKRKGDQQGGS